MDEKLLRHFAEHSDTKIMFFTAFGEYFEGDPPERSLFEILDIPKSQLKSFALELIKDTTESGAAEKDINEFSRGLSAYTQFQDILSFVMREADPGENRHYCYYESMVYLREIGVCLLDKNILAAFTLLRPFMELSILHLYWFMRCEDKGYQPYYQWLNGIKNKPPFQAMFDYVFENLPTRDYIDNERISRLRITLQKIYRVGCTYNHSPKIEESVYTLSKGNNRLSLSTFFSFLFWMNTLLRQLVYLYILVYPMSLFPVERHKKWGIGGPAGVFIDSTSFAHIQFFLGKENIFRLRKQLKIFPLVQSSINWFEQLPNLSEYEIEESWQKLDYPETSDISNLHDKTDIPLIALRLVANKAKMRSLGWLINYLRIPSNDQDDISEEFTNKIEKMIRDW